MRHPAEAELQDWIDGLLEGDRAAAVEAHVAACDACAAAAAALRSLLVELHALPRAIEPERDLRPGIAARIAAPPAEPVAVRQRSRGRVLDRPLRAVRAPLAAAAVALVAVSSLVTALVLRGGGGAAVEPAGGDSLAAVEARYTAAIRELESLLRERRGELPPEALRLLGESLAVVDAALTETRAALRDEPDNPALAPVLFAVYERKLELLRGAAALESDT